MMNNDTTTYMRLKRLESDLSGVAEICSSGGSLSAIPDIFYSGFRNFGVGLIVCSNGSFSFLLSSDSYTASAGETVFIPEGASFRVVSASDDVEISVLVYKVDGIKEFLGNVVYSVLLYTKMSPLTCYMFLLQVKRMI